MATSPPNSSTPSRSDPPRLASLDAYRGFVMICLAANGFGIAAAAENFPDSALWRMLKFQFEHVPWVGCAFWDLIQPSFMFMVGVAVPFSMAKRTGDDAPTTGFWLHVWLRALILVLLGIFLSSNGSPQTNFTFVNVLTQIGLGYGFLVLLARTPWWSQLLAACGILIAYWAWFAFSPLPSADFNYQSVGLPADWPLLTGFAAHWQKNVNPAASFDLWWLNLFPRPEPYVFNHGGYQTLNFVPSLATMLFGVLAGELIRATASHARIFAGLLSAGLVGLALGWGLDHFEICPLVKRIWTPGWTLFSTGWTLLLLAGFYGVIDGLGLRAWAFPLRVAGMNSIALYVMGQLNRRWTLDSLRCHFGEGWPTWFGAEYQPIVESCAVLLAFWLFVYWLYRQRIFLKI